MYKSPISLIFDPALNDFFKTVVNKTDDMILEAVQNVGVHVDKEKLIQTLEDSTYYYDEGCKDGRKVGYETGYKNGYDVGYDDGFYKGLCEAESLLSNKVSEELEERKK